MFCVYKRERKKDYGRARDIIYMKVAQILIFKNKFWAYATSMLTRQKAWFLLFRYWIFKMNSERFDPGEILMGHIEKKRKIVVSKQAT